MRTMTCLTGLLAASVATAGPQIDADEWGTFDTDASWDNIDVDQPDVDPFVVGGVESPPGKWPDAVYVDAGGSACTGTLIHPRVVLTAAHCGPGMRNVTINSVESNVGALPSELRGDAEVISVEKEWLHPGYGSGFGDDIAVLVLSEPARTTPRRIAMDCIIEEDLADGVEVEVVGWGNTQANGTGSTNVLREGTTLVQTFDCSMGSVGGYSTGCAEIGTEIGAGGNGVDACFGDSGGPLYLPTDRGTYVVGVTSRAYAGVPAGEPCRYGGIYTRPDAYIDWIEEVTGFDMAPPTCNRAPELSTERVTVRTGGRTRGNLLLNDPDGGTYTYRVVREPVLGTVEINADGAFTVSANRGVTGQDSFILAVDDYGEGETASDSPATATIEVPLEIHNQMTGCSTFGGRGSSAFLGLGLVAFGLRRRS